LAAQTLPPAANSSTGWRRQLRERSSRKGTERGFGHWKRARFRAPKRTSFVRLAALWRSGADTARWIFGESLGDATADEIWTLAKNRPDRVTRTEVRDLFSRNKKAREIDSALTVPGEAPTRTPADQRRPRPPR
jgi:hypothetical protein